MTRYPRRPDNLVETDAFENPPGWEAGEVVHTGGGIWNRIWKQHRGEATIKVVYDPKKPDGVSAGLYNSDGEWLGVIKTLEIESQEPSEEEIIDLAMKLMRAINHGVYDASIDNLSP